VSVVGERVSSLFNDFIDIVTLDFLLPPHRVFPTKLYFHSLDFIDQLFVKSRLLLGVSWLYFTFSSYSKRTFIQVVYVNNGFIHMDLDSYSQDTG